ncbi:hypothetical protein LguiB_035360 [Lonicera macranthoides]
MLRLPNPNQSLSRSLLPISTPPPSITHFLFQHHHNLGFDFHPSNQIQGKSISDHYLFFTLPLNFDS